MARAAATSRRKRPSSTEKMVPDPAIPQAEATTGRRWVRPGLMDPADPYGPESVAVYRLYDFAGVLLYVGISDNPKRRFAQHADDKGWWYLVVRWTVEWFETRDAAVAAEARAIREECPAYNLAGVPEEQVDQRQWWLAKLEREQPTADDLAALFLAVVRARSLPKHLWPEPHRRQWDQDEALEVYVIAKDCAGKRRVEQHQAFIDAWNARQEEAAAKLAGRAIFRPPQRSRVPAPLRAFLRWLDAA